jgi:death on curing protein
MTPEFLDVDDVLDRHALQLEAYGGLEGVRDMGLLESAVAQPSMTLGGEFLHDGLFAMAAAYLYHIVRNHPFLDGNKRTGLDAATVFLDLNGFVIDEVANERLVDATLAVAEGRMTKDVLAALLAELSMPA